jgi:hypothetical protein
MYVSPLAVIVVKNVSPVDKRAPCDELGDDDGTILLGGIRPSTAVGLATVGLSVVGVPEGSFDGDRVGGRDVGLFVGASVGFRVLGNCITVAGVGAFVVSGVGPVVGSGVGPGVGSDVGCGLENSVGRRVRENVGGDVSKGVGFRVGERLGDIVGDSVGALVGEEVGAGVGCGVGSFVGSKTGGPVGLDETVGP